MSEFKFYSGDEFLTADTKKRDWLIEGFIRELDSVILVAPPKAGKSVLMFQLICSLTSQHPFLDKFEVTKPCNVTYIQLEGEFSDSQDRMKRMIRSQEFDPARFSLGFLEPQTLNESKATLELIKNIESVHKPDVLIIDPAYFAFKGKMSDDEVVRNFLGNLRIIKNHFNCTIILVHHTHKLKRDPKGKVIAEGDEAMFGSQFFAAWPDHVLFLSVNEQTNVRVLSCNTQRSGMIESITNMKMVEPDPLYFREVMETNAHNDLFRLMSERKEMLSVDIWIRIANISKRTFYLTAKKLLAENLIEKSFKERPILYGVKL